MSRTAQFLLASRSPRRRRMLAELGYVFDCAAADIDETPRAGESGAAFARRMACDKAARLAAAAGALPVLAADTDVEVGGGPGEASPATILGKPRDRAHGLEMLARLSAATHRVHCAVALARGGAIDCVQTVTEVSFAEISAQAAAAYWEGGEPVDKAGGYAIQGHAARWVKRVCGSYSAVIGLPLVETAELLARHGIHPQDACATAPVVA